MIDAARPFTAFSDRAMSEAIVTGVSPDLLSVVRTYWGFDSLRPLQAEAMTGIASHRDTIVVLPTGGGKSLCYQAPAMVMPGVAVVITPLLSLMKDQVDALTQCGIPAACLNSMQSSGERSTVMRELQEGKLKLLYVAPERLTTNGFGRMLPQLDVSFFAIDEAHCISSWGHEFRPDYRRLSSLRELCPKAGIHAFTATATQRVRADIAEHLSLRNPAIHVGPFDRPNLTYRVERKSKRWAQICSVIERHKDESGIIYCISRKNVEDLAVSLREVGYKALPYHAGLEDDERQRNQDAFLREEVDIIVATVAFGMGIDKSNVRYVLHANAPKSVENYQQEAGRAGRDGLPAECVLLWGPGDFRTWRRILDGLPPEAAPAAMKKLNQMSRFCESMGCRHRALVNYFGQSLDNGNCQACDVCLGDAEPVPDAQIVAQKILSCVVRLGEGHGEGYISRVLTGSEDEQIAQHGHDKLSTYAILAENDRRSVRDWITQLKGAGFLAFDNTDQGLRVTDSGWQVLRDQIHAHLVNPRRAAGRIVTRKTVAAPGLETELFDELRALRRLLADQRGVPAFVIFADTSLLDMARRRPGSLETFRHVHGVGDRKCSEFGPSFVECIAAWCRHKGVPTDPVAERAAPAVVKIPPQPVTSAAELIAHKLFAHRRSLDDVGEHVSRARSTVVRYLENYLRRNARTTPEPWVDAALFAKIKRSVERVGGERLRPLFDDLDGAADYDQLRIALACLTPESMDQTAGG